MSKFNLKDLVLAGVPQFEHTMSDGKKIKVRSMLLKELKLLMLAKEGGSEDQTIIQVLQQCILTDDIDVELLPTFEVELIFIQLIALSKGSSFSEVAFICQNEVDNKICGHKVKTRVNLKNVKLDRDISKENLIKVNDQMVLEMRYPSILERKYFAAVKTELEAHSKLIDMCLNCVKTIKANEQTLVVGVDIQKEELVELLELVSVDTFERITGFIETTPSVHTHIALKCPKCGYEAAMELKGLADFFD